MIEPSLRKAVGTLGVLLLAIGVSGSTMAKTTFRDCADCSLMRTIPAGIFVMGSAASEAGHQKAEEPQHRVKIARAFAIGVYDVTRREFAAFVRATGYDTKDRACDWRSPKVGGHDIGQHDDDPVVCVGLSDAHAYVEWVSKKTGHAYRLPSEAEWEYAARAGTSSARPWSDSDSRNFANYGQDACCGPAAARNDHWLYASPVGSFRPNAFGLYDMLGNVWQRTEDCGHDNYAGAPVDGSAWTASGDCKIRIVRGGAWFSPLGELRAASRAADPSEFRKSDIGFRVARSL